MKNDDFCNGFDCKAKNDCLKYRSDEGCLGSYFPKYICDNGCKFFKCKNYESTFNIVVDACETTPLQKFTTDELINEICKRDGVDKIIAHEGYYVASLYTSEEKLSKRGEAKILIITES